MKIMVNHFLYVIMVFILFCGCKGKQVPKPEMKMARKLETTWKRLENNFVREPNSWEDVQVVLKKHHIDYLTASKKDALQDLYNKLKEPSSKTSTARDALDTFVKLGATEVVRESLLNQRKDTSGWGLVIRASDAVGTAKDEQAIANLIHVLKNNNYPQPGSEAAGLHQRMKIELIETIQQITGLDLKAEEIDVDNKNEIEDVLSLAREWAKKEKIQLFKE